jgi:hypothetical protein
VRYIINANDADEKQYENDPERPVVLYLEPFYFEQV